MSKLLFTEEMIHMLECNPYVKKVSEKAITYTDEFREKFMLEYENGKPPTQIFREADFNTKVLGEERIKSFKKGCKKMALREAKFKDTRKMKSGRPSTKELTTEEQLERMKHKVKYLEQENEYLKKIEFLDRQIEWKEKQKQRQKKNLSSYKK